MLVGNTVKPWKLNVGAVRGERGEKNKTLIEVKWLVPKATFEYAYNNQVHTVRALKGFLVRKKTP